MQPTAIALGNFDGVHLGHRCVIETLPADPHLHSTVVSFDPHPQAFFSGQPRQLLTPLPDKLPLLEQLGVHQLVLLPFDRDLVCLSPQAFVEEILVDKLGAKAISVGFNFCFGYQRTGTATDLGAIASQFNIPVTIVPPQDSLGEPISSSTIRQALEQGDLSRAHRLLGRPYDLTGTVVHGQKLGRTLGFPTANLDLPADKFLPRLGVYQVAVSSDLWPDLQPGVMNLGWRPTVSGTQLIPEVHLLDWSGDLYGHTVTVSLAQFLRPEQTFASLEALKTQIQADCAAARAALASIV
nr:bifunctional riboflavin kinase/FAD synthetase [Petrachloros mirabilis]